VLFLRQGQGSRPRSHLHPLRQSRQRRVRQVPIPEERMAEVEESLRALARTRKLIKQIAQINLDLLKERKRRRQ
jgi:hypothetical protein